MRCLRGNRRRHRAGDPDRADPHRGTAEGSRADALIYLVRHGETVFNAEGRFQGHADSPLTALGEAQARAIGSLLRDLLDGEADWRMVSSPLGRARRTAEIIADVCFAKTPIVFDDRLREISLGSWDGLTRADIAGDGAHPEKGPRWWFLSPDGETYEAFDARLCAWLEEAVAGPKPLVVVSHGGAGRVIRGRYLGLTPEETFALETPQDCVFRLWSGQVHRLDAT